LEAERQRREAEKQAARQKQEAEELERREQLAAEVTARRKKQAEETVRLANEEAERAQEIAEIMRREAEEEIKRLQAQADASRLQAELEVKRSIAASRREVDQKKVKQAAQAKARKVAALKQSKKVDDEKARRTREAREAAMRAIGKGNDALDDDLDDFLDIETAAAEVKAADDTIIVNEAQIQQRARDRENLIDPTEVLKVEKQEQKRQWLSDDFIWEATLGYRDDPNVDAVGSPADSVGVVKDEPKKVETPSAKKSAEKGTASKPAAKPSMFETQDINRNIRPQLDVPDRRRKRTFGIAALFGAALFLVVVAGGGWYYMSGDEAATQLGKVVGQGTQTLSDIKDQVSETIGSLGGGEDSETQSDTEAGAAKPVDEEAMARLRERLESMKATAKAKTEEKAKIEASAKADATAKLESVPQADVIEAQSESPAVQEAITENVPMASEPGLAESETIEAEAAAAGESAIPQEEKLETVEDVMKALSAPAESTEDAELDQQGVVESVDSLPIIDEAADSEAVEETTTEATIETSVEVTAEAVPESAEDEAAVVDSTVESTEFEDLPVDDTVPVEAVAEPAAE